jgi:rubrerythrin
MRNQEPALMVLLRAIQNEIATQRFYDDAASYCIDPWAKEVFGNLAREREDRAYLLLCEYESLRASGRWHNGGSAWPVDAGPDFSCLRFEEGEKPEDAFLQKWAVDQAIDRRSDDLEALAFGVLVEKRTLEHYQQAEQAAEEEEARQAYEYLIQDETRHYRQLKDRWEKRSGRQFAESTALGYNEKQIESVRQYA